MGQAFVSCPEYRIYSIIYIYRIYSIIYIFYTYIENIEYIVLYINICSRDPGKWNSLFVFCVVNALEPIRVALDVVNSYIYVCLCYPFTLLNFVYWVLFTYFLSINMLIYQMHVFNPWTPQTKVGKYLWFWSQVYIRSSWPDKDAEFDQVFKTNQSKPKQTKKQTRTHQKQIPSLVRNLGISRSSFMFSYAFSR